MEFTRTFFIALGLTIVVAWANDDPFTGSWKMQVEKSKGVRPDVQTFTQTADGYHLVWHHKNITLNMYMKLDGHALHPGIDGKFSSAGQRTVSNSRVKDAVWCLNPSPMLWTIVTLPSSSLPAGKIVRSWS
jgi:hypothetical protein